MVVCLTTVSKIDTSFFPQHALDALGSLLRIANEDFCGITKGGSGIG